MASWAGSARAAGRRPAGDGGAPKTARRIREAGAAGPPLTGAFSTLLRPSGLRASTAGILATKSERKMLAITCLYSLYAWFHLLPASKRSANVYHNDCAFLSISKYVLWLVVVVVYCNLAVMRPNYCQIRHLISMKHRPT